MCLEAQHKILYSFLLLDKAKFQVTVYVNLVSKEKRMLAFTLYTPCLWDLSSLFPTSFECLGLNKEVEDIKAV